MIYLSNLDTKERIQTSATLIPEMVYLCYEKNKECGSTSLDEVIKRISNNIY